MLRPPYILPRTIVQKKVLPVVYEFKHTAETPTTGLVERRIIEMDVEGDAS